ncbi:MAG: hypothetical protein IJ716_14275 [Lachnospiraceae bacterium]|nr:hypothetical protein [Lachnospiraceae bacterium]
MANISSYLESIKSAESGEIVRDSIIGALKKINADNPTVIKPLNVTANGTYSGEGVAYGPVTVNVPGGQSSPIGLTTLQVSENGYYEAGEGEGYIGVQVNVPQSTAEMREISITENGEYDPADEGYDGYSKLYINVPKKGDGGPYTVTFHANDPEQTVIQQVHGVPEGGGATYAGYYIPEASGMVFVGWTPNPVNVDHDMDCYPRFENKTIGTDMIAEPWYDICRWIEVQGEEVGYEIGQWKPLDVPGYKTVNMHLVAKGVDPLEGLNGYAATTWVADIPFTIRKMGNIWPDLSESDNVLRYFLNETLFNTFPDEMRSYIKPVVKYSKTSSTPSYPTVDKLWVPSAREMIGGNSYENLGPIYNYFADDIEKRKISSSVGSWTVSGNWLRSSNGVVYGIAPNGTVGSMGYANNNNCVLLGFCI